MTIPASVVFTPTAPAAIAPAFTALPSQVGGYTAPVELMSAPPATPAAAAPPPPPPLPYVAQPAAAPTTVQVADLPPELHGKTYGEVLEYYGKLRAYYLNNTQAPAGQPQQPQVPTPQPAPAAPEPTSVDFWSNPIDVMRRLIKEENAPITGNIVQQQIVAARNTVAEMPAYASLEGSVLQALQNIPAEQLTNPAIWRQAYNLAVGDAVVNGRLSPEALRPQAPSPVAPTAPPTISTVPSFHPTQSFFTEAPRAVVPTATALSTAEQAMAAKMGMAPSDYAKWRVVANG